MNKPGRRRIRPAADHDESSRRSQLAQLGAALEKMARRRRGRRSPLSSADRYSNLDSSPARHSSLHHLCQHVNRKKCPLPSTSLVEALRSRASGSGISATTFASPPAALPTLLPLPLSFSLSLSRPSRPSLPSLPLVPPSLPRLLRSLPSPRSTHAPAAN